MENTWKIVPKLMNTPTKAINVPSSRGGSPKSRRYINDAIGNLYFTDGCTFKSETFIQDLGLLIDMVESNEKLMLDFGILGCLHRLINWLDTNEYHFETAQIFHLLTELCKSNVVEQAFYDRPEFLKDIFKLVNSDCVDVIIRYVDLVLLMTAKARENYLKNSNYVPTWFSCLTEDPDVFFTYTRILKESISQKLICSTINLLADFGRLFLPYPKDNDDRVVFKKMFFTSNMVIGFYEGFMLAIPNILQRKLLPDDKMDLDKQLEVLQSFLYVFEVFLTFEWEGEHQVMDVMKMVYEDIFDAIKMICKGNYSDYIKTFFGHLHKSIDQIDKTLNGKIIRKPRSSISDAESNGSGGSDFDFRY